VHKIAIAIMPEISNNNVVTVATQQLNDFTSISFSDRNKAVDCAPRKNLASKKHYSTIGSANEVIKETETQGKLRKGPGILYVETAGLMGEFSCLAARGTCDYADLHKNKTWERYAAASAAAYAKELLSIIPAQGIAATTKAADAL
jgi:hypothetical protein